MLHIDLPSRTEIEKLAAYRGAPAVSIYLRTTPRTQEAQADRIELKNLLKMALARLDATNMPKRQVWPIESAVDAIIEDDPFWAVQANSLAIFASDTGTQAFRLPNKLVNAVEVSDRFHLKPLLRSVTFPHHAYVLAIGVGAVRLVEVTADLPPRTVPVPGMPRDMGDALGRRSHVTREGAGHSGEGASEHALLARYARVVDHALRAVLKGEEAPLIVAATEPMASIYRNASGYPHVATQVLAGSFDATPDHALADAARGVLDAIHAAELARLREAFAVRGKDGRATADIAQAARAATFGAVETLVVDMDTTVPGQVADADGAVTFAGSGEAVTYGVVDEIARRVLQSGGRVVSGRRGDVPGGGDLAALLRYPV